MKTEGANTKMALASLFDTSQARGLNSITARRQSLASLQP